MFRDQLGGVGTAAAIGLAVGSAVEANRAEARLDQDNQRAREAALEAAATGLKAAGEWEEYAKAMHRQAQALREQLQQTREEVRIHIERANEAERANDSAAALLSHVQNKLARMQQGLRAQSANVLAYERLYTRLVEEVKLITDPAKFANLDPVEQRRIVEDAWDEFMKGNDLSHIPKMPFDKGGPKL